MTSVLKLALEGAPSEEFNASLRTLEAEEHAAMQACALSSTPVFDLSVVAFTAKAVVEVCIANGEVRLPASREPCPSGSP